MRRASIIVALGVGATVILLASLSLGIVPASAYTMAPLSAKSSLASGTDIVTFPDPNLESVIRNALGKPQGDITTADLARIIKLDGFSKGITDLTNIQYCVNLTELDLRHNRIADISPLSKLTKLTTLYLRDNRISDITPLSNLTGLVDLTLRNNQISDISPLAGLTRLKYLYLHENRIADIWALSKLTGLTILDLSNNLITDVSPLRALVNLKERRLDSNPIRTGLDTLPPSPPKDPPWIMIWNVIKIWFWRIVWSIVAIVFTLVLAVRVVGGGRSGSEIVVCANGHRVSKKKFDELGECPTCGTDLYHRTDRHAE